MASNPLVQAVDHFSLSQLVADPNLCRNVLNDVGAQPAEVFVLVAALEARIPQTLIEHTATNDLSVVEPRLVAELNQRGVELSRAQWAVNAWKEVVGGSTLGQATARPTQAVVQPPVEAATVRPTQPIIGPPQEAATVRPTQPVVAPQPVPVAATGRPPVQPPPVQHPPAGPPTGPPRRDNGGSKRTVIVLASIVVLLVAGIVVLLATRSSSKSPAAGPTSSATNTSSGARSTGSSPAPTTSPTQSSAPPSTSVTATANLNAPLGAPRNYNVQATVAWTDTGVVLTKGERINITASGEIKPGPSFSCGPNGLPGAAYDIFSLIGGGQHHAALIGLIAGTDQLFLVGADFNGVAPAAGRLYLGINDVGVGNNSGHYATIVRVQQT